MSRDLFCTEQSKHSLQSHLTVLHAMLHEKIFLLQKKAPASSGAAAAAPRSGKRPHRDLAGSSPPRLCLLLSLTTLALAWHTGSIFSLQQHLSSF